MGWLHSRPKQSKNDTKPVSRLELYPKGDPILSPHVPDVIVVGALHSCGIALSGGMGRVPITWQELKAYSDLSKVDLTSWEAERVISMSKAYCSMIHEAGENRAMKAPYTPELADEDIYNRGAHASGKADKDLSIDNY